MKQTRGTVRLRLTDRQLGIFQRDMREFGFPVSLAELRTIADQVADDTHNQADPVARIMASQIDEAMKAGKKP